MAARRNSKAPKVNVQALYDGLPVEAQDVVLTLIDKLVSLTEGEAVEAPAPRKPSPRKPKADAPKADSRWVKGCTFTYVKADKSESQHRIVRTEGDHAIARALASGQERRWLLTTLDAMHQTKNVRIAK